MLHHPDSPLSLADKVPFLAHQSRFGLSLLVDGLSRPPNPSRTFGKDSAKVKKDSFWVNWRIGFQVI
jgi:hypothetical protein